MTESWKLWEGQTVAGKFPLREYLGGSDHSAVFRTERSEAQHPKAAIKLIVSPSSGEQPDAAESQLSQWRQAAKLSHPHLLQLLEMGSWQRNDVDLLYVVMEYAEENLSQILPERALTPTETREMLGPTLDALAALHSHGFVHGHMKPSNIMATEERLKISTDGLWRMDHVNSHEPKTGPYDAPEAASGKISPAGDVWSLGMTLVEVLTQRLPEWDHAGHADPVVPGTLPAPFRDLAQKCLVRDAHHRWQVSDIALRLRQGGAPAPKPAAAKPPRRQPVKRNYVFPAVATVVALVVFFAIAKLFQHPALPASAPPVTVESAESAPAPEVQAAKPAAKPAAKKIVEERRESSNVIAPSPAAMRTETPPQKSSSDSTGRGQVLQQVLPNVSQKARDTIHGKVRLSVRVAVDSSGSVTGATLDAPGPSKYFAEQALQAARRWQFAPPNRNGRLAPSEWLLRFEFTPSETKVSPAQTTP